MEETISELKDRSLDISQLEEQKAKRAKKNEKSLHELWEHYKHGNPKERKEAERLFKEITAENFSFWGKKQKSKSRRHGYPPTK